jgi:antitoxin (DNA-binding transcriptional repressor) of toxin-antitoxin stability system
MDNTWSVQDAKARFSEFLRQAETKPQIITCRGKPKFEVRAIKGKSSRKPKLRTVPDWWLFRTRGTGVQAPATQAGEIEESFLIPLLDPCGSARRMGLLY